MFKVCISRLYVFYLLVLIASIVGCTETPTLSSLVPPQDTETVTRGKTIVTGLAACGNCHGERAEPEAILSGGREITLSNGSFYAPNITPAKSGIGQWSTEQLRALFRTGLKPSGDRISYDVHSGIEWMSEHDLLSVIAYLSSLAPVENSVPANSKGFLNSITPGFFSRYSNEVGYVPEIARTYSVQYGGYLTDHIARCIQCHNSPPEIFGGEEYLGGGRSISVEEESKSAPGLLHDDLLAWKESDLVTYLREGKTPSGDVKDSRFCPYNFYRNSTEDDLALIAKYLKSL